jgi:hypothetical protein
VEVLRLNPLPAHARRHLSRGRGRRRTRRVGHSSRLVPLVFCLLAIADGCDSGTHAGSATRGGNNPTPAVPTSRGIDNAPSGGPAPTKLQGHWLLVSKSGHTFTNRFELEIRDRQYGFPVGLVRGHLVTHGDEVDFYNEDLCSLPFPQGVGRYRWTVKGERLHLARIDNDPCATRRGFLEDATYRRLR